MFHTIGSCVPRDHARQVRSDYYVEQVLEKVGREAEVLDLGCGSGGSIDLFRSYDPTVRWKGLDIADSPEVNSRKRDDALFYAYDGVNIPFNDCVFDIVYSHQVFEHVRHPEALLAEVRRILKVGGAFIGSVSSLEPYHSFSYWSFTPYGWYTLLSDAGLRPLEFRPGIDGRALLERQYRQKAHDTRNWFNISPLNAEIDQWAEAAAVPPLKVNRQKLRFCGHLIFFAERTSQ